ncbi:hypothetical protein JGU71_28175 [Antrihabitans sp. YC3-6]|uniref:Minor tail protein n=1 Tax=Antrihabitans stalagmiti TaxID=2799499 RepID=A0A934NWX9_9NOCA|nr:hypothetical protein [Antrihabitans stalagmiti]MBJ8342773.1 hypothetical protein [Antrihabitans stalagmiti]
MNPSIPIKIIGAGNGEEVIVNGPGARNITLGEGQVQGIYETPVDVEYSRARKQRGATFKGLELPDRQMTLGFNVVGGHGLEWSDEHQFLRSLFTYQLDPWWDEDELARIVAGVKDDIRELHIAMSEEPDFNPDLDPEHQRYGNVFYKLIAAQPLWESPTEVTVWETSGSSGSGLIPCSNPTDQTMYQTLKLTRGIWTAPDVSWVGAPRRRKPGGVYGTRTIPLQPVTSQHGTVEISLDPMKVMFRDAGKSNVTGQVGGNYFFMHPIPPHTPLTMLPISVTGAPAGGARAELHQPRLWGSFVGGY